MKKMIALSLLVVTPLSAAPAVASPADTNIQSSENAATISPRDGGAQIELAQAYLRADRPGEAANAYRRALTLDNVMLETPTGDSIWSHQVAKHALSQSTTLTAR
jgi:hypothetical protein